MKINPDNFFVTSDTHINHKNICRGSSEWTDKSRCRDFDSVEEMNDCIIDNINSVVKRNDTLLHLGDVLFGRKDRLPEFMDRINCKNIHLCLGNHDLAIRENRKYQDYFLSCQDYLEVKVGKQHFVCNHYGYRVWNGIGHGYINLFGHSHGSLPGIGKQMDVGLDAPNSNFRPFSFYQIMELMDKQEIFLPDHHNSETNIR